MPNPYALGRTDSEIGVPNSNAGEDMLAGQQQFAFVSPTDENPPYTDTFGWAAQLKSSPIGTPDASRLQQEPLYEFFPQPGRAPTQGFYPDRDAEKKARHSVEQVKADGQIPETKVGFGFPDPAKGANRFARNPREIPPPEPRITTKLAPISYSFMRPFMTGLAKNIRPVLNGIHFSMADHKRNKAYDSTGMIPQRMPGAGTRNTYRLTPAPWDTNITDMPPVNQQTPKREVLPTIDVRSPGRSWRLG